MIAPAPRRMTSASVSFRSANLTITGTWRWRMRCSSVCDGAGAAGLGACRTGTGNPFLLCNYRPEGGKRNSALRGSCAHALAGPPGLAGGLRREIQTGTRLDLLKQQARVVPPKTKAVAHRVVDLAVAGLVRRVVEVALGVGIVEVDRRRHEVPL